MDKIVVKKETEEDMTLGDLGGGGTVLLPTQRVSPTETPLRSLASLGITPSLVDSTISLSPPSSDLLGNQRIVFKVKHFLSTLIKFGSDISGCVGEKVKDLVFNLVVGVGSVGEFHRQLQEVTNFPLRPFVLPFLHAHIPLLQREIQSLSSSAGMTSLEYLNTHESSIFQHPSVDTNPTEASEIFHSEAAVDLHHHAGAPPPAHLHHHQPGHLPPHFSHFQESRKRRTSSALGSLIPPPAMSAGSSPLDASTAGGAVTSNANVGSSLGESAAKRLKQGTGHASMLSPPLFPAITTASGVLAGRKDAVGIHPLGFPHKWSAYPGKLAIVPGCPSSGAASGTSAPPTDSGLPEVAVGRHKPLTGEAAGSANNTDDEWKNVHVMLNCILGMVEKTQRAINILQQRQSTAATNLRTSEELIEEVQNNAIRAVNEVKQTAMQEIARARMDSCRAWKTRPSGSGESSKENGLLRVSTSHTDSSEICWNCGRAASETCSGCKVAKYCGHFCQHKDWEHHHRVCRPQAPTSVTAMAAAAAAAAASVNGLLATDLSTSSAATQGSGGSSEKNGGSTGSTTTITTAKLATATTASSSSSSASLSSSSSASSLSPQASSITGQTGSKHNE